MYLIFIILNVLGGILCLSVLWFLVRNSTSRTKALSTGICLYLAANSPEIYALYKWENIICPTAIISVRKSEHVEGFFAKARTEHDAKIIMSRGYVFFETTEDSGSGYLRYELDTNGSLSATKVTDLKSRYVEQYEDDDTFRPEAFGWSTTVRNLLTGDIMGQQIKYYRMGGPLFRWFMTTTDNNDYNPLAVCPDFYSESVTSKAIPPL